MNETAATLPPPPQPQPEPAVLERRAPKRRSDDWPRWFRWFAPPRLDDADPYRVPPFVHML